ncbi:long-chain fatty acid--CoA ligase [Roseivirga sp. BDSF3-8]|uniref:AMP-dependent synthetase/ligase n=1 Tax=Roseivirga sp. BDSF3-8 TaxID=3241598 RepID=UPI0035320261
MKPTRLFDLLPYQKAKAPLQDTFAFKLPDGTWKKYSTDEVIKIVDTLSLGLLEKGLKKDDKVAIISFNRPEWNFVDLGMQQIGVVSVPLYPTITPEDYRYIFQQAGVKIVFVADKELYDKTKIAIGDDPIEVYSFDKISGVPHWTAISQLGNDKDSATLDPHRETVTPEDLLTLIYTSGTTGKPKGVMLTHSNILSNAIAVAESFPLPGGYRALSFLPLCHIFERTAVYYYLYSATAVYYAESMETIGDNLKEVKPHLFTTVPRLLEKVYEKIVAKGRELTGIKKSLFFWALGLGEQYELPLNKGWWYEFRLRIANKIIFSKWREALGNNIEFIISGAAALQPRLAKVFWAADIKVLEAYGLTETSPGVSFTRLEPENARIGCAGPALPGVQIKIAEDGEICVKGPNVMQGYYKSPELTAEVIDKDGYFHTGDVGELVENRFLRITDRKKEMFKTSGGKYIAPQPMENKFKESMVIEQIMIIGDGEKFPAALIVPSFDALKKWCELKEIPYSSDAEMIGNPSVQEKFDREISKYNESFAQYERVKQFRLLPEPWSIEGGELTPTLKLKRKAIMEKHGPLVNQIYAKGPA